jgi:hypothetical protein
MSHVHLTLLSGLLIELQEALSCSHCPFNYCGIYLTRSYICAMLIWFPAGARDFSLLYSIQTDSWTHPASYPIGTRGSFPGGEADHIPPSSAELKNGGAMPPLPHTSSWHPLQLIIHRSHYYSMLYHWAIDILTDILRIDKIRYLLHLNWPCLLNPWVHQN